MYVISHIEYSDWDDSPYTVIDGYIETKEQAEQWVEEHKTEKYKRFSMEIRKDYWITRIDKLVV